MEATRRKIIMAGVSSCLRELLDDSSSSSSEDEWNVLEKILPQLENRKKRRRTVPRIENYVEQVIPRYTNSDFQSHFRLSRESFEFVLSTIGGKLSRSYPGQGMISPKKQILITIWRMATPDSYRSICEKFNISRATALACVRRVTANLVAIAPGVIRWPTRNLAQLNWRGFEGSSGFPKVIGAIDGTHFRIPKPKINPEAYVNRKSFHSVQAQAVCDHKARFIHVLVGHVGSVHDQRVFRLSEVHDFLGNEEKFPDDCHLLGDAAYKLHQNLLVPYRDNGHLTERQKNFNFCHSSARMAIERAFGLLKGRFRSLLHCTAMTSTKDVSDFVLACFVLHNICIMHGDESEYVQPDPDNDNLQGYHHANPTGAGTTKRDHISEMLIIRHV